MSETTLRQVYSLAEPGDLRDEDLKALGVIYASQVVAVTTGEIRPPKMGEWFIQTGTGLAAKATHNYRTVCAQIAKLIPIETKPVLNQVMMGTPVQPGQKLSNGATVIECVQSICLPDVWCVLAHWVKGGEHEYVTWRIDPDTCDAFYGHYHANLERALQDFRERTGHRKPTKAYSPDKILVLSKEVRRALAILDDSDDFDEVMQEDDVPADLHEPYVAAIQDLKQLREALRRRIGGIESQ